MVNASEQSLPLPEAELPAPLRRFCKVTTPAKMRLMAAKGLVPVRGSDQVTLVVQLSADPDDEVRQAARESLARLPDSILWSACEAELHPAVLDALALFLAHSEPVLMRVVGNPAVLDSTLARIAALGGEHVSERIATNEQRLLGAPRIVEALYKNPATRMSTADRLLELAVRNGLELRGIPMFEQAAQAVQGQLIPEPSEEPLPTDVAFQESLQQDDDDPEAIERDRVDGSESLKQKYQPLAMRIAQMSLTEKLRLSFVGNAAARALLVRDCNKQVAMSALSSPKFTVKEALEVAHSRAVDESLLRYIANKRDWLRNGELKRALVFNPKTPVGLSLRFLSHMRLSDLKALTKSRNVAAQIKAAASQYLMRRERAGRAH